VHFAYANLEVFQGCEIVQYKWNQSALLSSDALQRAEAVIIIEED
jgi:hypothetical protein